MTLEDGRSFKAEPVNRKRRSGESRHYACFACGHEKLAGRIADGGHINPIVTANPLWERACSR
jgi:hypothetical protein